MNIFKIVIRIIIYIFQEIVTNLIICIKNTTIINNYNVNNFIVAYYGVNNISFKII